MKLVFDIAVIFFLAVGSFFSLTAAVGVLRFPDFYSRLHPAGKNDTMGVLCFGAAMFLQCFQYDYGWTMWGRIIAMALFMMIASPFACHAITQAAYLDGIKPWRNPDGQAARGERKDGQP